MGEMLRNQPPLRTSVEAGDHRPSAQLCTGTAGVHRLASRRDEDVLDAVDLTFLERFDDERSLEGGGQAEAEDQCFSIRCRTFRGDQARTA